MQTKSVGVVIPIYNVEKYLKECLDSVINQTYKNLQIILVNDGSTDENSLKIAKEYTLKDERFVLFDKENGGQSSARNVGIEYFSGEYKLKNITIQIKENSLIEFELDGNNPYNIYKVYKSYKAFNDEKDLTNFTYPIIDYIIFLDPDDYWELNCIEECVPRMDGVEVVWFDYKMFYDIDQKHYQHKENLTKSQMQIYEYYKPETISSMQWLERCLKINADLPFWCVCGGMYSFSYLLKIKLKFLDGLIHEDIHFGILLFVQTNYIYVFPKQLYYYRIRSSSTASYDKVFSKASLPSYIHNLYQIFNNDPKAAKEYHMKSSIFLNAWHIREFIKNNLEQNKGILLEEAFFMFLYFWYFDFVELNNDPKNIKNLLKQHKPVYEENHKRYPEFDFFCKYGLVRYRIQNQLSYILGKIIIENNKIYNFYTIPFKIIFHVIKFKLRKKEKLPKLEEYPDYNDIYRIKNFISYQFGKSFIESMKKWYIAKPLLLPFIWYKIVKKHKVKKSNYSAANNSHFFVFPDNALVNISENKFAIQSSLSINSKSGEALRVLNTSWDVKNYTLSTLEDNPSWYIIDLNCISYIEMIRITNAKNIFLRKMLKSMKVFVSSDNVNWTFIPEDFYFWKYNDYKCDVIISNKISARYIKIVLKNGRLYLSRIEIFKRKNEAYIISSKPDGLGMRLASILVGMYLAKKMNFSFGFLWHNSIDLAFMGITKSRKDNEINYLGNCMDEVDVVFDEIFIQKHLLSEEGLEYSHGNIIRKEKRTFDFLSKNENFEKDWGWYSTDILPNLWIKDCDEKECLKEIKEIYRNIGFSKQYNMILDSVEKKIKHFNHNFVALHIRGGDIIFSNIRKTPNFTPVVERLFPYEIALEIAINELKNNKNIVIFGQDLNANNQLCEYLNSFVEFQYLKIVNIDTLIDPSYSEMQRAFFEINFMSKAEIIYSAKESVFSKVAMMISGSNNLRSFHSFFSSQYQFNIINKNLNKIKLHRFQTAMSYFRLFQISRELNYPIKESINYLNKALVCDCENDAYRIYILQCLFVEKQYKKIDLELKQIFLTRKDTFLNTFLNYSLGSFNDCYEDYMQFDDINYPYIIILGYNISMFLGNIKRAEYLKTLLNKSKLGKNEIFQFLQKSEISAVGIVKFDIRYRLGNEFIKKNILKIFQILRQEKKENKLLGDLSLTEMDLKQYPDYNEAIKCQEHLSYKIGQTILQAYHNRFKGGYLLLPYKIYKAYKDFKKKEK